MIRAGQEQTGARIKTGLEEMKASNTVVNRRKLETKTEAYPEESDASQENTEAVEEHYEGAPRGKATRVLTTPPPKLYEELLKDRASRSYDGRSMGATRA
jgi:hypothetical protein